MAISSNKRRVILQTAAAIPLAASLGTIVSRDAFAGAKNVKTAAQPVIDPVLRRAADAGDVAGVVAMAATADGVVYQGAFGKRDVVKGTEMTLDSVFWIASMTKAITATAAMQLVEQGKLQLDAPIGKLLPDLAAPQVLEGFDEKGQPKLRPAKRPITLRHLLTHTAGFSYDIWNANTAQYMKQADVPGIITCKDAALKLPLSFEPGTAWEYGINIDFAGKAVEAVSGKKLDVYLREHLFQPLDMADTGFILGRSQRQRLVTVHARNPAGKLEPIEFGVPQDPEFFMGGGGLYGTARDYLAFLQMLMHGGKFNGAQVLRPETVALMSKNQIGNINVPGVWKTSAPGASLDVELSKMFPNQDLKWGLSFLINTKQGPAGRSAGSLTWAGLANTYFWLDPGKKVAGVILTQSLPFVDPKVTELYGQFESSVYKTLISA